PLALAVFAIGFAVFASGLHLTIIGIAKDDRSASSIGTAIVTLLSLVGGTFLPSETYPPFLRRVPLLTPNGAAQHGLVDILAHGRPFAAAAGHAFFTWAWALGFIAAAIVMMRRAERRA